MEVVGNDTSAMLVQFWRALKLKLKISESAGELYPLPSAKLSRTPSDFELFSNAATTDIRFSRTEDTTRRIKIGGIGDSLMWSYLTELTEALKPYDKALSQHGYQLALNAKPIPLQGATALRNDAETYGKWARDNQLDIVVIALGGNDALYQADPETIYRNLYESIKIIQSHAPDTRIVLNGLSAECMRRGAERKVELYHQAKAEYDASSKQFEAHPELEMYVAKPTPPIPLPKSGYLEKVAAIYPRLLANLQAEPGGEKVSLRQTYLREVDDDRYFKRPEGWSEYWQAYADKDAWKDWLLRRAEDITGGGYSITRADGSSYNVIHPNTEGQKIMAGLLAKDLIAGPIREALQDEVPSSIASVPVSVSCLPKIAADSCR
jgi:hypothetical protein